MLGSRLQKLHAVDAVERGDRGDRGVLSRDASTVIQLVTD